MTYLELVRRLAQEVGAAVPVQTAQNVDGELARLSTWVNDAWVDIQQLRDDWRWRQAEFEVVMPANTAVLSTESYPDFYRPVESELYVGAASGVYTPLVFVPFNRWQGFVRARPSVSGVPAYFTVWPDMTVEVYPRPASDTAVRGLYVKQVQTLVNDADTPIMPEQFHMAIVYKAMMLYSGYEAAPEVYQSGAQGFNRLYAQMVMDATPVVELGGFV